MLNRKNTSSQVPIHSPSHKDHIVLGKINPPHSYRNDNLKPKYPSPPLKIHSKPFHMEKYIKYYNKAEHIMKINYKTKTHYLNAYVNRGFMYKELFQNIKGEN